MKKTCCLAVIFWLTSILSSSVLAQVSGIFLPPPGGAIVESGAAAAPVVLPAAVGKNVEVNSPDTAAPQNETSVAVNPLNPSNFVVGLNDYTDGDSKPGYRVSFDSGRSWQGGRLSLVGLPRAWTAGGDPALGFDKQGNAYYVCVLFNRNAQGSAIDASVLLYRSTDGGLTWLFRSVVENGFGGNPFQDKPYLAIDTVSTAANVNRIYVAWTEFDFLNGGSRLLVEYSSDLGATFVRSGTNPLVQVAPGGVAPIGAIPAVDRLGNVYVAWVQGAQIVIRRSINGGLSFQNAVTVANIAPLPGPINPGNIRYFTFPSLAVDLSGGPNRGSANTGYLYVAWAQQSSASASNILVSRSTNGGANWSAPVRVNNSTINHRFFPWLSVGPDGVLTAIFYDRRDDLNNLLYSAYYAQSFDGGLTFGANFRASEGYDPNNDGFDIVNFIGDYIGIATVPNTGTSLTAFGAWAGSAAGAQNTDIWGAFLRKDISIYPEVVDGGGYATTFYLTNLEAAGSAQARIDLFTQNGAAWNALPSGSSQTITLNQRGTATVQTIAAASTTVGWATVTALDNGRVETTAVLQQGVGGTIGLQAGIFPSHPFSFGVLPVRRQGNSYETGISFVNPNPTAVTLTLQLRDALGGLVETEQLTLPGKNQTAQFVSQLLPGTPSNFLGTVQVTTSSANSRVSTWIDNFDFPLNKIAWVPTVRGDFPRDNLFAQVVDSGGFKTSFRFVNYSSSTSSDVTLTLLTPTGGPWNVLPGNTNTFQATVAASGSASVATTGNQSQASVGWARVTNDGNVGPPELIQFSNGQAQIQTEGGTEPFPNLRSFSMVVAYEPASSVNTGLALANPNNSSSIVTLNLIRSDGVLLRQANRTLAANQQVSQNLNQWFPGITAVTGVVLTSVQGPGVTASGFLVTGDQWANLPILF